MKSYLILGGGLMVLLVVACLFWLQPAKPLAVTPAPPKPPALPALKPAPVATSTDLMQPKHRVIVHIPFTPEELALMQWRAAQIAHDPAFEWKTPINFYGLVIDENNRPLSGTQVKWITTNVKGNGYGSTASGYDGRFFIGTNGKAWV